VSLEWYQEQVRQERLWASTLARAHVLRNHHRVADGTSETCKAAALIGAYHWENGWIGEDPDGNSYFTAERPASWFERRQSTGRACRFIVVYGAYDSHRQERDVYLLEDGRLAGGHGSDIEQRVLWTAARLIR
jgi:hypothetical protein